MANTDLHTRVPMSVVARRVTMHVTMTGVRRFTLRLRLATQLLRLAAWVAGFGIRIDMEPTHTDLSAP